MKCQRSLSARFASAVFSIAVLTSVNALADDVVRTHEKLDRGLLAVEAADGSVYLSWRLLAGDPADMAFDVYRQDGTAAPARLNAQPVSKTTDFVHASGRGDAHRRWFVQPIVAASGDRIKPSKSVGLAATNQGADGTYITLPLQDDITFQKSGIADLDGDGAYDYVIKQPNDNIDPYEKYWKPSPDCYQLEAYRADGSFLWRYDLGWAIERGIWYSPYVVYDLDGDGRAEVAVKTGEGDPRDEDGRVNTGPEFVTILDGKTGRTRTQIPWIDRELFEDGDGRGYNYSSRNQMAVAYLDGKTPSLLVERGTYRRMILAAYDLRDGKLQQRWRWDNKELSRDYWGQGAHWMHAADVDGDGRQEVVMGSVVIDDDGTELWTTGLGHPDHAYVSDIDPKRPGLEIYYGIESRRRDANGMCLVDARTGEILWGYQGPTRHVHSYGMCSDIDAEHPGSECYSTDTDEQKKAAWSRLHSSEGEVLSDQVLWGFGPRTVYWDADPQRELLRKSISNYGSDETLQKIDGRMIAVADVLGDWREEIIVSVRGELRIYTTTIPAVDRRVCLMQDPLYRMDVVVAAMGYYQIPMLSYDMASEIKP